MLNKCKVDKKNVLRLWGKKNYLLQKMVEKYMRSRQKKPEITIYNSPLKKNPSSFTRGEINAKCKERKICAMKSCDGNPAVEDLNNSNTRQN